MGGHHRKALRKEKSKVKLKAKKTVLTKAQNVTDTSFKVRKIVLREQLKSGVSDEMQMMRKQNVKLLSYISNIFIYILLNQQQELLSKLGHYNIFMQKSSLAGLQELVTHHYEDIPDLYLTNLIEGTARLILDQEKDVRKDALKLLNSILTQVPVSKVLPFFNVLLSYLKCGMTHIHTSIQDDSLTMLDILLVSTPVLVAANANTILSNFLDMISSLKTDSSPERTLTVNLSRRLTSTMWRMKVLRRLKGLLSAVAAYKNEQSRKNIGHLGDLSENTACSRDCWNWKENSELYIPVYNLYYRDTCHLPNIFSAGGNSSCENGTEEKHLKEYVKVLVPLLTETWREVAPDHINSARNRKEGYSLLSVEAAEVLKCTLEILQLLCELLTSEVCVSIISLSGLEESNAFLIIEPKWLLP
ncbi:testis-expressed protein 10 [Zootermopsis nevadensis]|uniref:testis-expressed protein 10 n=1 Tax=Zootermopsis nevadensis TaxID=136037 RepID=UPI000B8E7F60|nr:testis-expressed protein 10 [Zootermopsis nevadensis]